MPILKVTCPECSAGLKSGKPDGWPAGTRIICPKCQHPFAAADAVTPAKPIAAPAKVVAAPAKAVVAAAATPPPKKKPKVALADEDEDDDRPAKKKGGKKGKAAPAGKSAAVAWGIRGVVALGLIVATVVVLGIVSEQSRKNAEIEKENARISQKNAEIAAQEADLAKPITPDQVKKAAGK